MENNRETKGSGCACRNRGVVPAYQWRRRNEATSLHEQVLAPLLCVPSCAECGYRARTRWARRHSTGPIGPSYRPPDALKALPELARTWRAVMSSVRYGSDNTETSLPGSYKLLRREPLKVQQVQLRPTDTRKSQYIPAESCCSSGCLLSISNSRAM